MKTKLPAQLTNRPTFCNAKLVEGHEASLAICGHLVKVISARDERPRIGQIGQMSSRLAEIMDERGAQAAALARASGIDASTLSKLVTGKRKMAHHWALKLAPHLKVEPDDLMVQIGRPIPSAQIDPKLTDAGLAATIPPLPPRDQMPRDVPVMGTAMGANGEGAFELNQVGGIVDMVLRGPGIANSRKVFAIYVEGESMWPRFRPGALLYCDPSRPPRIGDDVVIVMAAVDPGKPPQAYLKELVRRSASEIVARQFNPDKELRFPTDQVQQVIRVLTMNEVMGI